MIIKRALLNELKNHLSAKEISIIIGPRQVGKTTLMKEIEAELRSKKRKVLFLNLDIENDKVFFESQELLLRKIRLEIGNTGYVFIDEIQRKENAGLFLKGIYDLGLDYKFVISGSGSLELKEKIHESLTGRKRLFELLPVTFEEFVNYKTDYKYENKLIEFFDIEPEKTENLLSEYISFGGYPRILTEISILEKNKIINEIYRSYIEKDIVSLLNIDRPDAFSLLIKILSSGIGKIINYSNLAKLTGLSIVTLKKYLWYSEKTYVVQTISPFFRNTVKELTKSRSIYFYDLGLRNFAIGSFSLIENMNEISFLFQNFVKNILYEQTKWTSWDIRYWRTTDKAEVDFVAVKGERVIPFEVKYSKLKDVSVKRSLRSFIEKYSPKEAYVINLKFDKMIKINNTKVSFIPFYKLISNKIFDE